MTRLDGLLRALRWTAAGVGLKPVVRTVYDTEASYWEVKRDVYLKRYLCGSCDKKVE